MNTKLIVWLSEELEARGWSQRELARRANLSQTSISAVLANQRRPSFDLCAAIAGPLDKDPIELFRLAGLLPAEVKTPSIYRLPVGEDVLEELREILEKLPREEHVEIVRYARYRLERLLDERPALSALIESFRQLSPEERQELARLILSSATDNLGREAKA